MSILMGLSAGRLGELISFEPHPLLFRALEQNLGALKGHPGFPGKVILHEAALSDTPGEACLLIPPGFEENDGIARLGSEGDQPAPHFTVRTRTVDGILGSRTLPVMKLDVEGHELSVLRGAAEALRQSRIRHLIYEDHQGASSPVHSYLSDHGYAILQIGFGLLGPVLSSAEAPCKFNPYVAPSYLASRDTADAMKRCQGGGWRILGSFPR